MGTYTLSLPDTGQPDLGLAGGKGASLGELAGAGFPVPPGFVVTTAAYRDFIEASGLKGCDPEQLRQRIPAEPVPEEIAAAILSAHRALDVPTVAVRSSGTAEDLADASFAGQHDTYLNVSGERAVLDAVRECWASLWTPRAVAYRRRRGWDGDGLALAVVVQAMVDAEWAGVMFTADPVTGRRDQVVIEAVRGLGEALVSGEATGHRYVVDKGSGRAPARGGELPAGVPDELAKLGIAVEDAFGRPQDIEWTYAYGRCSLVQARPLTALPAEPISAGEGQTGERPMRRRAERSAAAGRRRRLGSVAARMAADHMPYPPHPMDVSLAVRPVARAILGGLRSAGFATPDVDEMLVEIDDGVVQVHPPRIRPTPQALAGIPSGLAKLAPALRTTPDEWSARYRATVAPLVERIDGEKLAELSERELVDRVEELRRAQGELVLSRFGCAIPGLLADRLLEALLQLALGPDRGRRLYIDLMSAIPSVTRDASRELDRLAGVIRETPELQRIYDEVDPAEIPGRLRDTEAGVALLADVESYLRLYGCRQAVAPLPGFTPLRETPEVLHGLLQRMSSVGRDDSRAEGEEPRTRHARAQLATSREPRARAAAPLAFALLDRARRGVASREESHFSLFMVPAAVLHRVLAELGRRLAERGLLDDPADVFYLELDEASDPRDGRLRETAARRRASRDAALDHYTVVPIEGLRPDGDGQALTGTPASRGTAAGRVRVVRDESEFAKLESGDVLVCPYTNPAWTPLFSLAGAVVADAGGLGSHAAIVAREYGIPAVMGTFNGTRSLEDGQWVRVDGDTGTVTSADESGR